MMSLLRYFIFILIVISSNKSYSQKNASNKIPVNVFSTFKTTNHIFNETTLESIYFNCLVPKKKVLAVEPCENLAKLTKKKFKTYPNFWNKQLSKKILNENSKVDLIFSSNTISHIPNLKETFEAAYNILSNNGVFIIEDPSLSSIIKINSYDQFYDEHVYVFSALSMSSIVKEYNLKLFDVEKISNHGGSLRYYICKQKGDYKLSLRLKKTIDEEKKLGLNNYATFKKFAKRVEKSKKKLITLLKTLKKKNKKIISYGATYKSTTVFNYCKIGTKYFNYVTDTTKNKQGKFTPGMHIPILPPEKGFNESVYYAYLGAWNFKEGWKIYHTRSRSKNYLMLNVK